MEQTVSAKKTEVVQGTGDRGQSYESVVTSGIFYGAVCWACILAQTQNLDRLVTISPVLLPGLSGGGGRQDNAVPAV